MRGEQDNLVGCGAAAQDADGVPGLLAGDVLKLREALLDSGGQWIGERGLLQKGAVVASGFEAEGLKLRGDEESRDVLVACGGAAAVEFVVGEKVHVGVNFTFERRSDAVCAGCCVE